MSCLSFARSCLTNVGSANLCLCSIPVFLEYCSSATKTFPKNLPFIFSLHSLLFTAALLIGPATDFKIVDNYDDDPHYQRLCHLQGFTMQYFSLATMFWYVVNTNIMFNLVVKNERVPGLERKRRRYYIAGVLFPLTEALIPLFTNKYGPDSAALNCWFPNPWTTFYHIIVPMALSSLWGKYRGFFIVRTLYQTHSTTLQRHTPGVIQSSDATILTVVKDNLNRQIYFHFMYTAFSICCIIYFFAKGFNTTVYSGSLHCSLELLYTNNVCMIGGFVFIVFGLTRANLEKVVACKKQIVHVREFLNRTDEVHLDDLHSDLGITGPSLTDAEIEVVKALALQDAKAQVFREPNPINADMA